MANVRSSSHHLSMNEQRIGPSKVGIVPLTTSEALLSMAERIQPYAPFCITMYNNLMQHGHGHASYATFYILKDCPNSHVVMWEWTYSPTSQHVGVFCLEEEVELLTEALAEAPFVDWSGCLTLHHIPPYLLSPLQRLTEKQGAKLKHESCVGFTYHPNLDTEPLRLDPGLRVCHLGEGGLRHVLESNKYERDVPLAVLRDLAQSVPYLGVYLDSGVTQSTVVGIGNLKVAGKEEVPVAWSISGYLGEVAKTETVPEYRRRGLGGLITTVVARKQASLLGFIPHCFVVKDNFASRAMITRKAGWQQTHEASWLYHVSLE